MHKPESEATILRNALNILGQRPDLLCVWRANTGAARIGSRFVRFGQPGQADISGILQGGRRIEIEVKTATGRTTLTQDAFKARVEGYGGLYALVRSTADVVRLVGSL